MQQKQLGRKQYLTPDRNVSFLIIPSKNRRAGVRGITVRFFHQVMLYST
jgi:hypothetical protein